MWSCHSILAGGGWYFLGKDGVSSTAFFNMFAAALTFAKTLICQNPTWHAIWSHEIPLAETNKVWNHHGTQWKSSNNHDQGGGDQGMASWGPLCSNWVGFHQKTTRAYGDGISIARWGLVISQACADKNAGIYGGYRYSFIKLYLFHKTNLVFKPHQTFKLAKFKREHSATSPTSTGAPSWTHWTRCTLCWSFELLWKLLRCRRPYLVALEC